MRNPFIAGSWVRGDNFFGRTQLLRDILDGSRDSLWVIGARRMGKTSLLKEIEARTQASKETPYLALYWDLQGSADARGLADGLIASVEDNEHFRRAADVGDHVTLASDCSPCRSTTSSRPRALAIRPCRRRPER